MTDSLDPFLRESQIKKPQDLEKLSRHTVDHDRWDWRDFNRLLKQMPELNAARTRLAEDIAGDLGYDEGADAFFMLHKINPERLPDYEIRPTRLLNARVNEELEKLSEYQNVRRWTMGEQVGAALAFEKMEPDIAALYSRLQNEIEKQQELEEKLKELAKAQQDEQSVEEMIQQWMEENKEEEPPPEGESEEGQPVPGQGQGQPIPANLQEALGAARAARQAAEQEAQQAQRELMDALDAATPEIRDRMQEAAKKADEYLDNLNSMAQSWGQELTDLMRLPAEKRLELAQRLNTPKFQAMAKLIGPFQREALADNARKVVQIPEEITDVTTGDDIPRVIPSELAKFDMEETEILFLKDLTQKNLVQYEMKGTEKIARGGIIYIHDGSGSMEGQREIWAKGMGLALLAIARKQKRSFYGIQFGSTNQIRVDDFRDTRKLTPERVIDFAEFFYGGGTDFQAPLKHAMDILKREHAEDGAVRHDIVFVTDGCAGVTDAFMKEFKELQRKLDARVYGIAVAAGPSGNPYEAGLQSEPLRTICDGRVATIDKILNAKDGDLKKIFRSI